MYRTLKSLAAVVAWWMCYIPLNAFIVLVFLKQIARGGDKRLPSAENRPTSDDQRIQYIVEKNLGLYREISVNEGIGTKYERLMVDRLLLSLARRFDIGGVLETPADGITGVPGANSLCLARLGNRTVNLCNPSPMLLQRARETWISLGLGDRVEVKTGSVSSLPYPGRSFDLVWSFCMLEQMVDPRAYLRELARVSEKLVLVVTVNNNAGLRLHRRWHKSLNKPWDHGRQELMTPDGLRLALEGAGLEVLEIGGVDAPPSLDSSDMPLTADIDMVAGLFGRSWNWKLKDSEGNGNRLLNFFAWIEDNMSGGFRTRHAHHLYAVGRPENRKESGSG